MMKDEGRGKKDEGRRMKDEGTSRVSSSLVTRFSSIVSHPSSFVLSTTPSYVYTATVDHVLDGDTQAVVIDLGFDTEIFQKLRLAGIDTPEIGTPEGEKAKRFVQARLPVGSTIVIRTSKSDKYDRYLADVFYLKGEKDPVRIAKEGTFLNQELLDKGLAVRWSG